MRRPFLVPMPFQQPKKMRLPTIKEIKGQKLPTIAEVNPRHKKVKPNKHV